MKYSNSRTFQNIQGSVRTVDVMVDSCGIVQECQCDCAAGMGPEANCKHVCIVLITLTRVKGGHNLFGDLH